MTIYFDMDGTIANLYGVENWLDMLLASDPTPYSIAQPLVDMDRLETLLLEVQKIGIELGIITWLSKAGSPEYNRKVSKAKKMWLSEMLPNVDFNELHIIKYGLAKHEVCWDNGILFDDEEKNRNDWKGIAYDETKIFEILENLIDKSNR